MDELTQRTTSILWLLLKSYCGYYFFKENIFLSTKIFRIFKLTIDESIESVYEYFFYFVKKNMYVGEYTRI